MAVMRALRKFVGQQELIENTGGHQDGFAGAHGQGEDVVRVGARVLAHLLEQHLVRVQLQLVGLAKLEHFLPRRAEKRAELAALKLAAALVPRLKNFLDLGVAKEFLEKNVGFQRFELRLAQEGFGILVWVVEIKELASQLLIILPDRPTVILVELPQKAEEGEI